jgi:hypothetical protein
MFPQAPQFLASVVVSTQVDPQAVRPDGQRHIPPAQLVPLTMQAFPQAPQLPLSVCRSTHRFPQGDIPIEQVHVPPTHAAPIGHTVPQAPQLVVELRSASQPFSALLSQL